MVAFSTRRAETAFGNAGTHITLPDSSLLSHDPFPEGSFRAEIISDTELKCSSGQRSLLFCNAVLKWKCISVCSLKAFLDVFPYASLLFCSDHKVTTHGWSPKKNLWGLRPVGPICGCLTCPDIFIYPCLQFIARFDCCFTLIREELCVYILYKELYLDLGGVLLTVDFLPRGLFISSLNAGKKSFWGLWQCYYRVVVIMWCEV